MDQLYFESGYIETNYFTILKDTGSAITVTATMTAAVDIANTANYFIPDYIEEGYFQAPVKEGEASLTVTCTHLTDAQRNRFAQVNITDAFNVTFTVNVSKNMLSDIISQFNASITASKIASNQSTLNHIVTLSLQGDRSRALAFTTLASEFALSSPINTLKNINSTINTAFSINADGDILSAAIEATAVLTAEFNQQVTGATIRNVSVATQAEFSHSTQANRIRGTTVDILIAFQSAGTNIGFLQDAQVNITDAFTPVVTASALKNHTAILNNQFVVQCTAVKNINGIVNVNVQINSTVTVNLTAGATMSITVSTSVNCTVMVQRSAELIVSTQIGANITVGKVVRFTDTIVHTVTDYGGVFYIDGVAQPTLTLLEGNTYIFNHPSNHPIAFSTTVNGTHGGGTEYTTGITRDVYHYKLIFVVGYDTPTLYYYCQVHSNMGGTALTPRPTVDIISTITVQPISYRSKWFGSPRPITWIKTTNATLASSRIQMLSSDQLAYSDAHTNGSNNWFNIGSEDFTLECFMLIRNTNTLTSEGTGSNIIPFIVAVDPSISGFNYSTATSYQSFGDFSFGFNKSKFTIGFDKNTQKITALFGASEIGTDFTPTNNDWFYVALGRQNGQIKLTFNSTTTNGFNYVGNGSIGNFRSLLLINSRKAPTTNKDVYFDSVQFKIGQYQITDVAPQTDAVGSEFTKVIGNFNSNLDDSLNTELFGSAALTSSATIVVLARKSASASAQLNSSHTLTAVIGKFKTADVNIQSQCSINVTGTRIKSFDSAITVNAGFNSTVVKTANGISASQSECAIATTITRIFVLQSNFAAIASQLGVVARVGAGLILAETFVTQSTTAVKITNIIQTLVSQTNSTITVDRIRPGTATLNTDIQCTINTFNSRIRGHNSAISAQCVAQAQADRFRLVTSGLNTAITLSCESEQIVQGVGAVTSNFGISIVVIRNRFVDINLQTAHTLTAAGIKAVEAELVIAVVSQIIITVNRVRPFAAVFNTLASKLSVVAKTGQGLVTIVTQSTQLTVAHKTTDITAVLPAVSTHTVSVNRTRSSTAVLVTQFVAVINGTTSTDTTFNGLSSVSTQITAQKIVSAITVMASVNAFQMTAVAIKNLEIVLSTQFTQVTVAQRFRGITLNISTTSTLGTLAGLLASANSVQNVTLAQTVTAGVLRLQDIIYYVPTETRTYNINNEQRTYALRQENRLYTIEE